MNHFNCTQLQINSTALLKLFIHTKWQGTFFCIYFHGQFDCIPQGTILSLLLWTTTFVHFLRYKIVDEMRDKALASTNGQNSPYSGRQDGSGEMWKSNHCFGLLLTKENENILCPSMIGIEMAELFLPKLEIWSFLALFVSLGSNSYVVSTLVNSEYKTFPF